MFDQACFNQAAFNFDAGDGYIYLTLSVYETVYGIFDVASTVHLTQNAAEVVTGAIELLRGRVLIENASEEFETDAAAIGEVKLFGNAGEDVTAACRVSGRLSLLCSAAESFAANAKGAAILFIAGDSSRENVGGGVTISATYYLTAAGYEILSASCAAESVELLSMLLNVTLEPGDVLVIDSDNYIVLKNGDNAIETHSGDWCWIDRQVLKLAVSGGLAASISYQELYL